MAHEKVEISVGVGIGIAIGSRIRMPQPIPKATPIPIPIPTYHRFRSIFEAVPGDLCSRSAAAGVECGGVTHASFPTVLDIGAESGTLLHQ